MKWLIALLTAATGILHIVIGFNWWGGQPGDPTNWLLVLNGVGYLVLLAVYWTASGGRRGTIRWLLLAYALITLIGYFLINGMGGFQYTPGLIVKAIELLLIILLFLDRGSDTATVPATTTTATRTGGTYSAPSTAGPSARAMTDVDATAAAGMSAAPLAMSTAALAAAAATGDTVEETAEEAAEAAADDWSDRVDYAADTSVAAAHDTTVSAGDVAVDTTEWAGDTVETTADEVGDAAAWTGDKAGDAVEATGDAVSGAGVAVMGAAVAAGDWVGDKADDAGDAVADAGVADWVGEPVDTTDVFEAADDRAGAAADWVSDASDTAGATAGDVAVVVGAAEDTGDAMAERLDTTEAAALDAEQLAAEPSPEQLRGELEEYLRSFGSSSEFRKGVEYIEGIGPVMGGKLRAAGVVTVLDLMVNGATRRGRKQLSDRSGITQSNILTWVNHVDLFRIKGVAEEYADLLEQSGVDTVVELAQRNPNNLFKKMNDINEQKQLVRRMPRQNDVQDWVAQAKTLKRLVHY